MARQIKPIINTPIAPKDKISMVREFLDNNYDIVINEFDTSQSFIRSKSKKYDYSITVDDIFLHLIEENIAIGMNVLKLILKSPNYTRTFNPITDYLNNLEGKYKGKSHIDLLCECIVPRTFDDNIDLRSRTNYIIKKWFVATAACALGHHANDVALGLVAASEGIGKTWLLRYLVPHDLRVYYKQSKADSRLFNMSEEFTRSFIINFDEFVGITRFNAELFKETLSSTMIPIKQPREQFTQLINRLASAVFTSNKTQEMGGFLLPSMGYRRFGIIEIESINKEYSNYVDPEQLWAEAVMLLNQDFDYIWNENDYNDFKKYNAKYVQQTTSDTLINLYFKRPTSDDDGEYLMASEILSILKQNHKITASMGVVSDITIGIALSKFNFIKKGIKIKGTTRYKYFLSI